MFVFNQEIAAEIVLVARLLYDKGLANAFEGNVSIAHGDEVYITPSAVCKGFLEPEQIVVIDRQGAILHADRVKPSSEYRLHLALYDARPDVRGIVHAHPPYCTAFAVAGREIYADSYPEALALYHKIPLAPYGRPSTDEIWKGIIPFLPDYDIVLLANHGLVAVGPDVRQAYYRLESAESIAKVLILSEALSGPKALPPVELEALAVMHARMRPAPAKPDRASGARQP